MPKPSTSQLIDNITAELLAFSWTEHFQEVRDMEEPTGHTREAFENLARFIARVVR